MKLKQAIGQATRGSSIYSPVRDAYQFAFNRTYWNQRTRLAKFFSQFIGKNDLVFDVGANIGDYTETFVRLGAHVVAVEPNPQLTSVLKAIRPASRIAVECVALGSSEGNAELLLCGVDSLATMSREWIEVATRSARFPGIEWRDKISVPVSTLDLLNKKYGPPHFLKIDVEGFESDVLAGLSRAPRYVMFEVNTEFAEVSAASLAGACFGSTARFNIVFGLEMTFHFESWVSRDELVSFLASDQFFRLNTNADIVIRSDC